MEGSESAAAAAAKEEEEGDHENPLVKKGGGGGEGFKEGKSCKGCLYYSSILKSKSRKPFCVGVSRTLQQVPGYIVGESDLEASKDARNLTEFKYACVGYSVYLDNKDPSANPKEKRAELPFCVGIELVVDKKASAAQHAPAPVRAHKKEDDHVVVPQPQPQPQPRQYKPAHSVGEELLGRFTRNAGLVASGVARNMHRVGNYVKDSLDDILYPYRRRPK